MGKRTEAQIKTIESFKKIDDNIYSLNYQNDYFFDKALDSDLKSIFDLIGYVQKSLKLKNVKAAKGDEFACSTFDATTKDGDHIMGRNFDYMEAPLMILWTAPKTGYKSVSICNVNFMLYTKKLIWPMEGGKRNRLLFAPYCTMDGVNEKGLAISILEIKTALTHQTDENKKNIQTTTIIRACLDKCATVDEAVAMFEKYNMNDAILCNYHFFVSDANGDTAIIEFLDNKISVLRNADKKSMALANFYKTEGGDNTNGFGQQRVEYLDAVLKEKNYTVEEDEAMQLLDNVHLDFTHRRGYQIITLWSNVYNTQKKSMLLCGGLDYNTIYRVYVDKPDYVEKVAKEQVTSIKEFEGFTHKDVEYK